MTRKIKDSGIEWIGQIPEDWKLVKVKDAFIRKNSKANDKDPVILSLARDGVKIRDISNNEGQLASDYSNYNPVRINDLLLNPMDLVSGDNCNIAKVEGVISPAYFNLRYKDGVNPELYNFYFKNLYWGNVFFAHGKGVSFENRWTLNYETLSQMMIPLPSISEQKKIADFIINKLDKVEEIKSRITKQIQTIEEYKKSVITEAVTKGLDKNVEMKDSGIEWIGEIPKHWDISKIKFLSKILNGSTPSSNNLNFWDGEIKWITPKDLYNNTYVEDSIKKITKEGYLSCGTNMVPINTILLSTRAPIGTVSVAKTILCTNQGIKSIVCNKEKLNYKLLYYYLFVNESILNFLGNGTTFMELSTASLMNLELPKIPLFEQEQIVAYLDRKTATIDEAITAKQKQLGILEEYKKSLIYEYVTGKKEVEDVGTI